MRRSSMYALSSLIGFALWLYPSASATAQTLIGVIGGSGEAMAVNPRTNRVYISNSGGGSVVAVDGYTHVVTNLPLASTAPQGLAINPLSNRIYVNSGVGNVRVLDGETHALLNTISGSGPVAFNLNSGRIYVPTGSSLRVLDANEAELANIAGVTGTRIAIDPLANQIFVADSDAAKLHVIDGVTHALQTIDVDTSPAVVAVNAQTRKVYLAHVLTDSVTEVDALTLVETPIPVGERPNDLVVDAVLNKIYVGHNPASASAFPITVIDGATRATTTIPAGVRPAALAFDAGTRRLYVANQLSGNVTVIDADTQTAITTIGWGGGVQASHIALNPVTHRVYVQSPFSAGMAVIDGATLDVVVHSAGLPSSAIAFDPVQSRIIALDNAIETMHVVDPVSGAATPFTPMPGARALNMAFDAAHARIYVFLINGRIAVVDSNDLTTRVTAAPVSLGIVTMAVDSARDRAFLVDYTNDRVIVFSGADLSFQNVTVGDGPQEVVVDPDSGSAYVVNSLNKSVSRIDGTTLAVTSETRPVQPVRLALDAARDHLFASLQNTSAIAAWNANSMAYVGNITTVAPVSSLEAHAGRERLYLGHSFPDTRMSFVNLNTLAAPTTFTLGGSAQRSVVDAAHDRMFSVITDPGFVPKLVILRGPTHAAITRTLTDFPLATLDPLSGRLYLTGPSLQRVNTEIATYSSLGTTISGPAGHRTETANATLNFTAASGATPNATTPLALFHRRDGGAWTAATQTGVGSFSTNLVLSRGTHHVQAFALDAFGATTQSAVGTASVAVNRLHNMDVGRMAGYAIARVEPTSIATTTVIGTIGPSPSVVGQSYSVPVTVSGSITPTGDVVVSDAAGHQCTITLAAGAGSCALTATASGAYTVSATYAEQGVFEASSDSEAHGVNAAATATTIVSDAPDPSTASQSVNVVVNVAAVAPGSGVPGGNVLITVSPGGANCGGTLSAGSFSCSPGGLTANGSYTIDADYAGDGNYGASQALAATHLVEDGANLAISIDDAQAEMIAGASTTYTIVATNAGPEIAPNARVQDQFAAALTAGNWTCTSAGGASCITGQPAGTTALGTGALNQFVDLPVGASVTFLHQATLASVHVGSAQATATVSSGRADANPANNTASDSNASRRVANLAMSKTNNCYYVPAGDYAAYYLTVNNAGPSDAPGTRVQDTPGGLLSADSWICGGSIGSSCTLSNGLGNIDQLVNVPANGYVRFLFLVVVGNGPPNQVTNTATMTAALDVEDSTPNNNVASDTDLVSMFAGGFEFDCFAL